MFGLWKQLCMDPDERVRKYMAQALSEVGTYLPLNLSFIIGLVKDSSTNVQQEAIKHICYFFSKETPLVREELIDIIL